MAVAYRDQPAPLAIAHRGGAGLAAENTLEAFSRSYALGLRCLETDVRITADGGLVAFHDAGLRRATGARGRVDSRRLTDIVQLPVLDAGPVLSLGQLLASFPDATFMIDVKDRAAVEPLAQLLQEHEAVDRVCAAAQWDSWTDALRRLVGPRLTTALSWRALTRLCLSNRPLRPTSAVYAHVPLRIGRVRVFADDLVARAHDAGLRVVVWTVNEPVTMHRLLDRGVDGIITDRPDLLREVLIARGQWHAPTDTGAVVPVG
ncbi:MAG: glycerophosphodiester phosphodiesterase family protein [Jatrophihabitans sp.]|uniref:glycerophosphodiester phosphodiesterase family protein n=1 Tax=Jatrophihabitans sp. TaxID=1932789 RepID=UPI003F7EBDF3